MVPRQLFDEQGVLFNVDKYYWTCIQGKGGTVLRDKQMNEYILDDNGFIKPIQQATETSTEKNEPIFSTTEGQQCPSLTRNDNENYQYRLARGILH